LSRPLV